MKFGKSKADFQCHNCVIWHTPHFPSVASVSLWTPESTPPCRLPAWAARFSLPPTLRGSLMRSMPASGMGTLFVSPKVVKVMPSMPASGMGRPVSAFGRGRAPRLANSGEFRPRVGCDHGPVVEKKNGGAWESNPPAARRVGPRAGFEDRGRHQACKRLLEVLIAGFAVTPMQFQWGTQCGRSLFWLRKKWRLRSHPFSRFTFNAARRPTRISFE